MSAAFFNAKIYKAGDQACIDVPKRIIQIFQRSGAIPVKGIINKVHFKLSLVPTGAGNYRLPLDMEILTKTKGWVGKSVNVELEPDS